MFTIAVAALIATAAVVYAQKNTPSATAPTFTDDFKGGQLDLNKWDIATSPMPNQRPDNYGVYKAEMVDLSGGLLKLGLTQSRQNGKVVSQGGEIKSKQVFGYGTYTFVMRMSSTSDTPDGPGSAASGSVSAGWNFLPGSETEIDIEFRGDIPGEIRCTNWVNFKPTSLKTVKKTTTLAPARPAEAFHTYTFVWTPGKVIWYMGGQKIAENTTNVPSKPAQIRFNHWGTDSTGFGGLATPGVSRFFYVKSVQFTPTGTK